MKSKNNYIHLLEQECARLEGVIVGKDREISDLLDRLDPARALMREASARMARDLYGDGSFKRCEAYPRCRPEETTP